VRLPDGRVVAVGSSRDQTGEFALAAYGSDGRPDRSFGREGVVRTKIEHFATAKAAITRPDGRILVAGCASSRVGAHDCGDKLAVASYLPSGSVDRHFGEGGVVITEFPRGFPEALAVALQRDGSLVVGGGFFGDLSPHDRREAVSDTAILAVRYDARGRLDRRFGRHGVVLVRVPSLSGAPVAASEVAIQADGKIVLGESAFFTTRADGFRLLRLNADGALDPGFGERGITPVTLSRTSPCCSQLGALVPLPDGRILAAGQDSEATRRAVVARFTASGSLDRSFDGDGIVQVGGRRVVWAHIENVFPRADGKVLAVGFATEKTPVRRYHYMLLALTPAGAIDRSFGQRGRVSTPTDAPALAALPVGRNLLVAGAGDIDARDVVFVRYELQP
jgi:uncharacterized delta-60 repeat protein